MKSVNTLSKIALFRRWRKFSDCQKLQSSNLVKIHVQFSTLPARLILQVGTSGWCTFNYFTFYSS